MQLTELLFQKVKDLQGQGQLALKAGYVAVVSRSAALRTALIAPISPAPDDQKRLAVPDGPTRVGVGMLSADGTPYRLLRELGGARQLLKLDPQTRKYAPITDDQLEIDSFLRVECGMPSLEAWTGFFVVEANELPSLRGKPAAAGGAHVDTAQLKALQDELALTQRFEGMQDRLFKISTRIEELKQVSDRLREVEAEVEQAEAEMGRSPWSKEQIADLTARARRAREELKRRDEALADIAKKRERLEEEVPPPPGPVVSDPWFGGGIAAGVLLDVVAFAIRKPLVALLGLIPFLAALIAILRWIQADEAQKELVSTARELKEREAAVVRTYEHEQVPLRAAMKAANVAEPDALLALFRGREEAAERREQARARLEELKSDPEIARVAAEVPGLEQEKQQLESEVLKMGFTRSVSDIESDLKRAKGISEPKAGPTPDAELPGVIVARAAEVLGATPEEVFGQIGQRLAAYLAALTDQRVAGARRDEQGHLVLSAAGGKSGSFASLPPPLRDQVYAALRLALIERVVAQKKLPLVVDDSFGALEPPKRQLVAKMLKGISSQAQVIHRVAEPPPAGVADAVLQA